MSTDDLQDVSQYIPDVIIDLRYATTNNITKKKLYKSTIARLRPITLKALKKAADELNQEGLRLVVWDAYRPQNAQKELREICHDDRYVRKTSNHSCGIAVDITLADDNGKYLDMGCDFDKFSDLAHTKCSSLTTKEINNRQKLNRTMSNAGFRQLPTEWWHFDLITNELTELI